MTSYDKSYGYSEIKNKRININLIDQISYDIGANIIVLINEFLKSIKVSHQFSAWYDDTIYINWYNIIESSDFFEFRLDNIYTIGNVPLEGGADCQSFTAKIINKINITFIYFLGPI
jgi:hypothetical protein